MDASQRAHSSIGEVEIFNDRLSKRTVFVTYLSPSTTADTLLPYAETFGTVVDVNVLRFKKTGLSKRVAFVTFLDEQSAQQMSGEFDGAATREWRHHLLDGTRIDVRRSRRKRNAPLVNPTVLLGTLEFVHDNSDDVGAVGERLRLYFAAQSGDPHVQVSFGDGNFFKVFFSGDSVDATERVLAGGKRRQIDESMAVSLKRSFIIPRGARRSEEPEEFVLTRDNFPTGRLASASEDMDFYEACEHLGIRCEHLVFGGVHHDCQLSFDVVFRPGFVFQLASHDMPDFEWDNIEDRPNILNRKCPTKLAGQWVKRMFDIGEEIAQTNERQCKEHNIKDKMYTDRGYSLVFFIGEDQSTHGWLGHIVFPAHTYFLFRLLHYRSLSPARCNGRPQKRVVTLPSSGVEDMSSGHVECGYDDAQRREMEHNLMVRRECRWCSMENWTHYVEKVAETDKVFDCDLAEGETAISLEILAKLARAQDWPGEHLLRDRMFQGDAIVPAELPLDIPYATRLCGERLCLRMDKDKCGSAELAVNFVDMPPLCTAEVDQIAKVVQILSELCRCLQLSSLGIKFLGSHTEAEAFLLIDFIDFVQLLSVTDARLWKFRWKELVMHGGSSCYRRWKVEKLCCVPPI